MRRCFEKWTHVGVGGRRRNKSGGRSQAKGEEGLKEVTCDHPWVNSTP